MPERPAPVPVLVEIGERLVPPADGARSGAELLNARVLRELERLMPILGVPGEIELEIAVLPGGDDDDLRMHVHGRVCRYPTELMSRVWSTLSGGWLAPVGAHRPAHSTALAGDVVATVCREILARRPSVLLGEAQSAAYVAGTAAEPLDAAWVRGTLARVLDARIALDDCDTITTLLAEQEAKLHRNAAEVLIERVRPSEVVVLVHREYLRALTEWQDGGADVLGDVRKRIERELGVAVPEIAFAEGRLLPERGIAFMVGDLETLTWIGLPADRCLVGDSVRTLALLEIEGEPALHPVTEVDCAVVPLAERATAKEYHIPTWGPDEYLGLCLEATLREHAACLVDAATVRARIEGLAGWATSTAVLARRLPAGRVVRLMRALLSERVSVSDFPALIEVLAEQEEELIAIVDDGIWSDRADDVQEVRDLSAAAAARRRLARQVAAGAVQHGFPGTISAVVLDSRLHQTACDAADQGDALSGGDDERLNASVAACLGAWPGDGWPVLLTNAKVRGAVRAALEPQFPDLSVIAFEELPFDVELELAGEIRPPVDPP